MDHATREYLRDQIMAVVAGTAMVCAASVAGLFVPWFSLHLIFFVIIGAFWAHRIHPNPLLAAVILTVVTLGLAWAVMLTFADDMQLYGSEPAVPLAQMGFNLWWTLFLGGWGASLLRKLGRAVASKASRDRNESL